MKSAGAFAVLDMPFPKGVSAIRAGLAAAAFGRLAKTLSISPKVLAAKIRVSERTVREARRKRVRLSPETSYKLVRVARVQRLAREVFSTDEAAAQWLGAPAPAFNGVAPFDVLDLGIGADAVASVLLGIAHGNVL